MEKKSQISSVVLDIWTGLHVRENIFTLWMMLDFITVLAKTD